MNNEDYATIQAASAILTEEGYSGYYDGSEASIFFESSEFIDRAIRKIHKIEDEEEVKGKLGLTEEMTIKAHADMVEKGQKLLDDLTLTSDIKKLIKQEIINSDSCMEVFGLYDKKGK